MSKKKNKTETKNMIDLGGGVYMDSKTKEITTIAEPENIYVGNKNMTDFPELISIIKKSQYNLKLHLMTVLQYFYKSENIITGDGYIYVRGEDPICLTSHMDTTPTVGGKPRELVRDFYEDVKTDKNGNVTHTITSPQGIGGDDRCGIWSILTILKETAYRPYIVFCEDEEIGCIGSEKFAKTELCQELSQCKFLVEIDRRGNNDAVFYDDDNQEFHKWVEDVTGYKEASGTCSDICNLSSACGVSSVNLSSGYYNEHTLKEKIIVEETIHTKNMVIKLLEEGCKDETEQFEYIEKQYYSRYWSNYYDHLYGDEDDYYGYGKKSYASGVGTICDNVELGFRGYFVYLDIKNHEQEVYVDSDSKLGCIAKFMMEYKDVCWSDITDYYFEELV